MQIKTITYHKVFNLGNYQNEKIGVEIALGEGDDPIVCHMEAVKYVEHAHRFQKEYPAYEQAKNILKDPKKYRGYDVDDAAETVKEFEEKYSKFLTAAGEPLLELRPPADQQDPDEFRYDHN